MPQSRKRKKAKDQKKAQINGQKKARANMHAFHLEKLRSFVRQREELIAHQRNTLDGQLDDIYNQIQ